MKIIDEFDYKVIMICKDNWSNYSKIKSFFKEELNLYYENDEQAMYYHLLEIIFNVYDLNYIKYILSGQLHKLYLNNLFEKKQNYFNYQNLCELLIYNLGMLKMKEKYNDTYTDLFQINVNGVIFTYLEYELYLKKKNKSKQLKK